MNQRNQIASITLIAVFVVLTVTVVLVFNYLATGLASDQGIVLFWKLADFDKLTEWGVLPELIRIYAWHISAAASTGPLLNLDTATFLGKMFRLDLIYPLLIVPAVCLLVRVARKYRASTPRTFSYSNIWVIGSFAISGIVISILFGQSQHISFYRFSSFLAPISILLCISAQQALWKPVAIPTKFWGFSKSTLPSVFFVCCVVLSFYPVSQLLTSERFGDIWRTAISFAAGRISIDSAYTNQQSWPGRMPWGGIYPGVRGALASLPTGERLRSFHVHSYCMIPDCHLESQLSYRLGADYVKTLYGSANEAMDALQASKLNYFLISTDLAIQDPLTRSPLFEPDSIAQYMGVVWTDGVTSLLTWKSSNATLNIAEPWLTAYRNRVLEYKNNSTDKRIAIVLSDLESRERNQDLKDVIQLYWHANIDNLPDRRKKTQSSLSPEKPNGKKLNPSTPENDKRP